MKRVRAVSPDSGANYLAPGWFNFACGANYLHQALPKEGHKIWLTQEADVKSWLSLKHVQPKEGRKELAPREIKFRYRRLDTAIREPRESRQFPREAQESEIVPGLFFFASFFSFYS